MTLVYRKMYGLLAARQKRRFRWLLLLMLVMGATELAGVALILPFLAVIADPTVVNTQPLLAAMFDRLDFSSHLGFLQFLGLATFAFVLVGLAVRMSTIYAINVFNRDVATTLGTARLRSYLARPYDWFLQQHSADLSKSVLHEINEVVLNTLAPAMRIVSNLVVAALLLGFVLWVDARAALIIAAVFVAAYGAIYGIISPNLRSRGLDRLKANRERYQAVSEALGGIKEVKMLGLESAYLRRYHDPSRRIAGHQAALALFGEAPRFVIEALTYGGMLLLTVWLLHSRDGDLRQVLPILGAFAFAGLRLMPVMQLLFRDISQIRYGQAGLDNLAADLADDVEDTLPNTDPVGGGKLGLCRDLRLDHVRYRYPGASQDALCDVSLTIKAGQCVGFAGSSGAGKTTVTDLLLGLITPRSGQILADGLPIDGETIRDWQGTVGFVPQTIHLVDDTITANIARGIAPGDVDEAAVARAVRLASLHDFVADQPHGLRTPIGEAGIRLSGGQRQRIGIARALYRDPDVLIFDEATSALDTLTERAVLDAIRQLRGHRTIILVSHRLSTLAACDTIFLMQQGRIVATDSYETLAAENPNFRAMLDAAE